LGSLFLRLLDLLVVLLPLVLKLLDIIFQGDHKLLVLITLSVLLLNTRMQLLDLLLVLLFLRLELGDDVVACVFLHLLEVLN